MTDTTLSVARLSAVQDHRELKRQNISVLFVSHKLEELFEIADMFTVIRDGQYIDARPRDQMDNDTLISLMVGRKVEFVHQGADKLGDVVLEVRHLSRYGNFKDVSFTVRKGEIVSLSGLVGAGRTEVVQAICGLEPAVPAKSSSTASGHDQEHEGCGCTPHLPMCRKAA